MARHEPAIEGTKRCKRCEQELPVTQFRIDRSIPGGRGNTCRSCVKELAVPYREANRDRVKAQWHEKMRDPEFREKERVRSLEKDRRRRAAMAPEELREENRRGSREWRAANPELSYEWGRRSKLKHRVLKAGGVWVEHVEPLVVLELDDGVCGICGEDVDPFDFDMDHIIPASKGGEHSYANVQTAHPACNQRKHNKILEAA
jgi:5-methylcytosine-specific restriction endonuclease McrA